MPQMVLGRNHVMRTTAGHIIGFRKGEPVYVPHELVENAQALGAEFASVAEKEQEAARREPAAEPAAPTGELRDRAILAAFREMVKAGVRDDFNAAGMPNMKPLRIRAGFDIDAAERNRLWERFQQSEAAQE